MNCLNFCSFLVKKLFTFLLLFASFAKKRRNLNEVFDFVSFSYIVTKICLA